ncbi:transposase [Bifidobacterium pseudocatenulatum]|uniref:transposase n=2 Tax=Bifidobacterium pseudocatenulatum TaxID=28026 RepID=UPI00216B375B|nr:transposase [Bifidobacterium pseudocatenulatum]
MEDGISMAAKRQVTLRFRDEYMRASKKQKGVILDRMCESLGIGRSTARRLLAQAGRRTHNEAVPAERPRRYSDRSRELLREVWVMMDMPCGKYLKTMLPQWLPMLRACGELDVRRVHVRRAHDDERGHGRPVPQTRARRGEFCRTLTVVDFATGWTENASARNNAYRNLSRAEAMIEERLPFAIRSYDNDNGSEFINAEFIAHLQALDVEQTRSRPYRKNDQATVESRNNHIVRRHAFYYRYTVEELDLLNELWELVRIKANLFTPSKKPVGRSSTRDGRPRRVYDRPMTPWERLKRFDREDRGNGGSGFILPGRREQIEETIAATNPAELVRRIHDIQDRLEAMAAPRTRRLEKRIGPDMAYLDRTLARITGVTPENHNETPADTD